MTMFIIDQVLKNMSTVLVECHATYTQLMPWNKKISIFTWDMLLSDNKSLSKDTNA